MRCIYVDMYMNSNEIIRVREKKKDNSVYICVTSAGKEFFFLDAIIKVKLHLCIIDVIIVMVCSDYLGMGW